MTGVRRVLRRTGLAVTAGVAVLAAGCAATPILGVRPAPADGTGPATVVFLDQAECVERGDRVLLAVPGAPAFEGVADIVRRDRRGRVVLSGRIDGGGPFVVADREGGVRGILDGPHDDFALVPVSDHAAEVVPRVFLPVHACRTPRHPRRRLPAPAATPATPAPAETPAPPAPPEPDREVRVLLVFASDALERLGGDAWAVAHARDCVRNLELALTLSGVPRTATLARAVVVEEAGSGDLEQDLDRLICWNDGRWDPVHAWRDAVHADVVALVVADGGDLQGLAQQFRAGDLGGGSRGFAQRGFLVLTAEALAGATVFVHEFGHVLGCGHNRDTDGYDEASRAIPSAHAYIDFAAKFSTLMCIPSTRAAQGSSYPVWFQFSTADQAITHNGVATGCIGNADDPYSGCDNAAAIRLTWDVVANLRRDDGTDGADLTYTTGCPVCAGTPAAHSEAPPAAPLAPDLLDAQSPAAEPPQAAE